jgi:putative CocE/NonD family hydrolase
MSAEDYEAIDISVLTVTGWFDTAQPGALYYWLGSEAHAPAARDTRHLVIGPWNHAQTYVGGATALGDWVFSEDSIIDLQKLRLAFFDRYLKGEGGTAELPDRCRLYVTGSNAWHTFETYPPQGVEYRALYLHSGGAANTYEGDGRLDWRAPEDEPPDRYTYDPEVPVIDFGALPEDRRPFQKRTDVLVYTSDVLEEPLTVIGPVGLKLYAASDCLDTDFFAYFLDVFPDGRAVLVTHRNGVLRARYRKGMDRQVFLAPNQPELFEIRLNHAGHTFLPGHRVRIEISSSWFPVQYPNPNTGNPIATDTESRVAHQTVFHDRRQPSHVLLPVVKLV